MSDDLPAWLQNRAQQTSPQCSAAAPKQRSARQSAPRAQYKELGKQGFEVPQKWLYDGCKRREPVIDLDAKPPRIVRKVGWLQCMCCGKPHFSQDVIRIRLCYDCKFQVDTTCQKATKESDP